MFYCIYSNKELDEEPSPEHVIPLFLGGCNEFVIDVGRSINNEYGSRIEGEFSKDLLAAFLRLGKKDNVGHHGNKPSVKLKGNNNGKPVTLTIEGVNKYVLFDHVSKKETTFGTSVDLEGKISLDSWLGLIAKITLATGFYVFGREFNDYADCDSLRKMTNSLLNGVPLANLDLDVLAHLRFDTSLDNEHLTFIKKVFKEANSSGVIFEFVQDRLHSWVGINGEYLGMINIKCDNEKLLKGEDICRISLLCVDGKLIKSFTNQKSDIDK